METLLKKRGVISNPNKIPVQVNELAIEHLKNIPHGPSHYSGANSNRLYFDYSDMNIKSIYEEFCKHYNEKMNTPLKMKYKIYFKCFRQTNFTFKPVKIDICYYCKECTVKLEKDPNDPCKGPYQDHKNKADTFY